MTLDEALREAERQFICHEWEPKPPGDECAIAPTGEAYVVVCSGGIVRSGEMAPALYTTEEGAVSAWLAAVLALRFKDCAPQRNLYWRIKPEINSCAYVPAEASGEAREISAVPLHYVYSRLLISDEKEAEQ